MTPQQATALATRLAEELLKKFQVYQTGVSYPSKEPTRIFFSEDCPTPMKEIPEIFAALLQEQAVEDEVLQNREKCLYGEVKRFKREFGELYRLMAEIGIDPPMPARPMKAIRILHADNEALRALVGRMKEALKEIAKPRLGGKRQQWTAQQALEDAEKVTAP